MNMFLDCDHFARYLYVFLYMLVLSHITNKIYEYICQRADTFLNWLFLTVISPVHIFPFTFHSITVRIGI